jgi:hypothetical protein
MGRLLGRSSSDRRIAVYASNKRYLPTYASRNQGIPTTLTCVVLKRCTSREQDHAVSYSCYYPLNIHRLIWFDRLERLYILYMRLTGQSGQPYGNTALTVPICESKLTMHSSITPVMASIRLGYSSESVRLIISHREQQEVGWWTLRVALEAVAGKEVTV